MVAFRLVNRMPHIATLAAFGLSAAEVAERHPELQAAIELREAELRRAYPTPADAQPVLEDARSVYRALGIDPSKHRPSSEALLRRVIQGKGLYRVNAAVDAANLASLSFHLSVGLYDAGKLDAADGRLEFRLGRAGEQYPGINKDDIHLEGRATLADRSGPFGNPSADSDRTKVTTSTRDLLFVIYAPVSLSAERLERHRQLALETLTRFVGGTEAAVHSAV